MLETTNCSLFDIAKQAKDACLKLAALDTETKNRILNVFADKLEKNYEKVLEANKIDLENAKKLVDSGELTKALFDRLKFTDNKYKEMVSGVRDLAKLPDPIGNIQRETLLDDDLILKRISCPIGVIGVIFESRPDVVVQISSLAIKSANAVILKGGSEAINTNQILVSIVREALSEFDNIPESSINLIKTREEVKMLLDLEEYIDLIIPRGSNSFVKYIQNNTKIPVLGHSDGICHIYVDSKMALPIALKVCLDSKIQYPSACNAVETILVHEKVLNEFLPEMISVFEKSNVEVRCDQAIIDTLKLKSIKKATEEDWRTEYSDLIVSIKLVKNIDEAIDHINTYGSGHTDCIITKDSSQAEYFMNSVDSASVYCNASTRFADGYRYGFGAEVGISTNKTHSRGPVGLEGLTIYKYKLYGNGNIVDDYSKGLKTFKHIVKKG